MVFVRSATLTAVGPPRHSPRHSQQLAVLAMSCPPISGTITTHWRTMLRHCKAIIWPTMRHLSLLMSRTRTIALQCSQTKTSQLCRRSRWRPPLATRLLASRWVNHLINFFNSFYFWIRLELIIRTDKSSSLLYSIHLSIYLLIGQRPGHWLERSHQVRDCFSRRRRLQQILHRS